MTDWHNIGVLEKAAIANTEASKKFPENKA
jgi:hypothetical protein